MCKLCDKFKPKAWNFCPVCGKEINIPRYNTDDTFEDLLKRVGVVPKVNYYVGLTAPENPKKNKWIDVPPEEVFDECLNTMNEEVK